MADVLDNHKSIRGEWRSWLYEAVLNCPDLDFLFLTKRPQNARKFLPDHWFAGGWPRNVWFGVTGEDQTEFDRRTEYLKDIPAPVRFVSVEPMLSRIVPPPGSWKYIDWIIAGGESGKLSEIRDTPVEWFFDLFAAARAQGIPYFQKQLAQISARKSYKDFASFPDGLRVRQQPVQRTEHNAMPEVGRG
jgi:protein gp37